MTFCLNLSLTDYHNPSATHILDAEVSEDLLVVVGMIGGIEFYDISNPESLNHLTSFNLSSGAGGGGPKPNCISIIDGYAYVTAKNGVAIIDISNPSNPINLGYIAGTSNLILENLDIYNQIINNSLNNPNLPVVYVGDHNTPSLLDWGYDNINQNFGFQIDWPVSEFLLNNGFYDSALKYYFFISN